MSKAAVTAGRGYDMLVRADGSFGLSVTGCEGLPIWLTRAGGSCFVTSRTKVLSWRLHRSREPQRTKLLTEMCSACWTVARMKSPLQSTANTRTTGLDRIEPYNFRSVSEVTTRLISSEHAYCSFTYLPYGRSLSPFSRRWSRRSQLLVPPAPWTASRQSSSGNCRAFTFSRQTMAARSDSRPSSSCTSHPAPTPTGRRRCNLPDQSA